MDSGKPHVALPAVRGPAPGNRKLFPVPFQKAEEMGARLDPRYGLESFQPPNSVPNRQNALLDRCRGLLGMPLRCARVMSHPNLLLFGRRKDLDYLGEEFSGGIG